MNPRFRPWIWAGAIVLAVGLLLVVSGLTPRLIAVYYTYWGQASIKAIFYEGLGLNDAMSTLLSVIVSFFYGLAWIPLCGWMARVLLWNFNAQQLGVALLCTTFVYGLVPIAHLTYRTVGTEADACFNQRTGKPQKWYVTRMEGAIVLFDSSGFDPQSGREKQLVTMQICRIFDDQRKGIRPRQLTEHPRKLEFFDTVSGEPKVWYYRSLIGSFELFDREGFHPTLRELLLPVTKQVVVEILSKAEREDLKSAIPALLEGCYRVPSNISRFVVIPTIPTGNKVEDFVLRFNGVLTHQSERYAVASIRHQVLKEGVDTGALQLSRDVWSMAFAKPDSYEIVNSISGVGPQAFNIETSHSDDLLVGFWLDSNVPAKIDWKSHTARTPALRGKCNLFNLVIFRK